MRKRPNKYNTAVTAVSHNDVAQPNKNTSSGQSKQANNTSSISIFAFILIVGALLTQTSRFANLNAVPDQLSEQEKVAAFVNWFRAEGGNVSDKIAINKFPEMGRGIVALQSVKENDNLLFVPKGIIICYDTIATEWSSHASLKKTLSKLKSDQEELLTAFLMLEQAKGHASRWAPYFQVLPSFISKNTVPSPLFSNEEDVDALQDERMIQTARTERQRAKKAYGRFKRLFRSFLDDKTMSLSRYLWTRFLVNSRAFSIRGQRVLVPFGDIFNGEPDDEARQQDNGQRFLLFHDLQPQGMTIRADRDTLSGQHLFEDYGDNSNYVYFLHHGFLMSDKGFDCAVFRLPRLAEASLEDSGILASKLHILSRIRVDDAPQVCISRAGNVEDSDLVRVYTALYNMNAEQVRACDNARAFSECFPSELMPDLDTELGYHELSLLLKSIKLQLEKYATTLEEDQTILQHLTDVTVSGNKHAVTFRLSRKQILREAQRNLATQLKNSERKAKNDVSEPQLSPSKELELEEVGNKLERFQQWIARHHFPVNSLELRYVSEAVGYGTFAVKRLAIGDVYLKVPVQVVMNVWSAVKSRWVSQTMQELQKQRVSVDREEMLLLLHLLEEKFGPNHRHSFWKPYLEMLPNLEDSLNSPLFYEEVELKTLEGIDLLTLVVNYRKRVARSYVTIASYLKQSGHDETLQWLTERRFRWANAVLDSRSIWWSGQRHLVPLLDMVNCQELNVNHKPHHTILDSSGRHAVTKSSWEFQAGQEVVENYAQTNYIYLLYHGFVLDSNSHDCAHFHLEMPVAARHRRFSVLLRSLEIFSWTPDLCVFPSDSESIMRFSKIALFVSDPEKALRLAGNAATAPSQATAAALKLVEDRLTRLESTTADMSTTDFRTQSILKFRLQQLHQLATLRNKLLPKKIK